MVLSQSSVNQNRFNMFIRRDESFFLTFQLLNSLVRNVLLTSRCANKTWPWFGCGRSFSDVTFLCLPFFLVLLHYNSRLNLPVGLSSTRHLLKFRLINHEENFITRQFLCHWRQTNKSSTPWKKIVWFLPKGESLLSNNWYLIVS